jgi:hypothetical protein
VDPRGLVLVPERIYRVFKGRAQMEPATREQLAAMGYPDLPDEEPAPGRRDLERTAGAAREPAPSGVRARGRPALERAAA